MTMITRLPIPNPIANGSNLVECRDAFIDFVLLLAQSPVCSEPRMIRMKGAESGDDLQFCFERTDDTMVSRRQADRVGSIIIDSYLCPGRPGPGEVRALSVSGTM